MDEHRELAVETTGLAKAFGTTRAVDGVDLAVRRGSIHGFLGPNGAGKTTTLRVLATLLRPDAGTARVFGHDVVDEPHAVRRRVSLTGQFASVDEDLTGHENLALLGVLWGHHRSRAKRRAGDLLDAFDLADAADRLVKTYSGGMQRRIDIAASLVVPPDLLFLDEPTTGLDPRSRAQVWDIVRSIVGRGTSVLLTTQYLDEADQLADRITVVDHGQVIADGTSAELKAAAGANTLHLRLLDPTQRPLAERLLSRAFVTPVQSADDPDTVVIPVLADPTGEPADSRALAALGELSAAGVELGEFTLGPPSLDEVFLALTGHPATTEPTAEGNNR